MITDLSLASALKRAIHSPRHTLSSPRERQPPSYLLTAPRSARRSRPMAGLFTAAICEGMATLNDADAAYFRQGPCFLGGSIPPTSDNQLKVYRDQSFTNTVYHEASTQHISVSPGSADYGQAGTVSADERRGLRAPTLQEPLPSDRRFVPRLEIDARHR
ncbi:hypothetical protein B0H67DRAFT_683653 [Lasiosphaeris hirsuta]|uniref:Uncharacterized protein n=1 Tax=Lasiosphaeris hirsuta TaxID=260670 RepID=A0AA40AGJ4_9PEZI|nr:hypothetical protein B0H67DRAFT_683653 [Lasiosphaeris hirsuta]